MEASKHHHIYNPQPFNPSTSHTLNPLLGIDQVPGWGWGRGWGRLGVLVGRGWLRGGRVPVLGGLRGGLGVLLGFVLPARLFDLGNGVGGHGRRCWKQRGLDAVPVPVSHEGEDCRGAVGEGEAEGEEEGGEGGEGVKLKLRMKEE